MAKKNKSLSEAVSSELKKGFDLNGFKAKKGLNSSVKFKDQEWIPLSKAFQDVTSVPGIPLGHISILRGHSDTGKTTALLEAAVAAQKRGVMPVFIITEMKWSWEHAQMMGLEVEEVIDEETAHDIIYKEVNKDWGFRSGNPLGKVIPPMDPDTERKLHLKYGRDRVPHNSASKIIGGGLEKDGILAWATWFARSEKEKNINITQLCLGHEWHYDGGMKPTIFAWTTHGVSSPKYEWIPLKTITEKDVKGVPLLMGFYKKALKIHGGEEGNGCLFASYFMEFAEGREKKTLRRWIPQEFEKEEDTLENTPEEKQYDLLLSANVRLEGNNREMKNIIMGIEEKINLLENGGESINRSPCHEFDDYKDWTRKAINCKVEDSNQIISETVEKNKEETFRLITNIAMVCAGACVIETIMKYWSTPRMIG